MSHITAADRGGSFGRSSVDALLRAERAGAAPGVDACGPGPGFDAGLAPAESSPIGNRAAPRRVFAGSLHALPRVHRIAIAVFGLLACAFAAQAAWVHAKATLGQWLLVHAWQRTLAGDAQARPWPWADTWPVARLQVPGRPVDLIVLAGANGQTLAWGPGHVLHSAAPASGGNAILTGHRDTHFAFLATLEAGFEIALQGSDGEPRRYVVERSFVAHRDALKLPADGTDTLSLVTCYPFDGLDPGTPLRFAVVARAAGGPAARSSGDHGQRELARQRIAELRAPVLAYR